MVDQPHPPGSSGTPPGDRPPGWLRQAILGALGLSALIDFLLGRRRGHGAMLPARADQVRPIGDPLQSLPENIVHGDGQFEHPDVSYERTDASLRWIVGLLIAGMCFAAFTHWVILKYFYHYAGYEAAIKKPEFPLVPGPSSQVPPRPRLEQVDRIIDKDDPRNIRETDMLAIEAAKFRFLQRWGEVQTVDPAGKVNQEKGYVHIPIDVAISLVGKDPSKYGAGYRKSLPDDVRDIDRWQRGLLDSGGPNSGRMFRTEARWFER